MLSRTADSLFWLARYMERAENMARLIDMGRRMTAIPIASGRRRNEWPSLLAATGCAASFEKASGCPATEATQRAALPHLMIERSNPSSVVSCFEAARANARSTRAALTKDMWEAVNDAWHDFRTLRARDLDNGSMSPLLDRIKNAASQFRGAADSSALRNDGYLFLRLGLAIERVDNMSRLLDIKTYVASDEDRVRARDEYDWSALLRAAGVDRAYHILYPADYTPARVFDFLAHDRRCPRSLRHSAGEAVAFIGELTTIYGARRGCADVADGLLAMLDHARSVALDNASAHEFLSAVIRRNNALSMQIAEDHHFAPKLAPQTDAAAATPEPRGTASGRSSRARTTAQTQVQSNGADAVLS